MAVETHGNIYVTVKVCRVFVFMARVLILYFSEFVPIES